MEKGNARDFVRIKYIDPRPLVYCQLFLSKHYLIVV